MFLGMSIAPLIMILVWLAASMPVAASTDVDSHLLKCNEVRAEEDAFRLVVRMTSAISSDVIRWVARASIPREVLLAKNRSMKEVITEYCGNYNNTYADEFKRLNAGISPEAVLPNDKWITLPGCVWWQRDALAKSLPGDTLESLLEREIGRGSNDTLDFCDQRKNSRCNRTFGELFLSKNFLRPGVSESSGLVAGHQYVLPLVTRPVTLFINHRCFADAQSAADSLQSLVNAHSRAKDVSPSVANLPTEEILPNRGPPSSQCIRPPVGADDWPFDAETVRSRLEKQLEEKSRLNINGPVRSVIGIVDNGIDDDQISLQTWGEVRRDECPSWPTSCEGDGKDNGGIDQIIDNIYGNNASREGDVRYAPTEHPLHGTQVADLALGGYLFRKQFGEKLRDTVRLKIYRLWEWRPEINKWTANGGDLSWIVANAMKESDIINLSLSSRYPLFGLSKILLASDGSDKLFIVAAGNEKADVRTDSIFPARLGGEGVAREVVVTVAAHDYAGKLTDFSNYSRSRVDITAPGCGVTWPTLGLADQEYNGTSLAAPLVSFTAALLRTLGLSSPAAIKQRILTTSNYNPSLVGRTVSAGQLDISRAIAFYHDLLEFNGENETFDGHWEDGKQTYIELCKGLPALRRMSIARVEAKGNGLRRVLLVDPDNFFDSIDNCEIDSSVYINFRTLDGEILSRSWGEVKDYTRASPF